MQRLLIIVLSSFLGALAALACEVQPLQLELVPPDFSVFITHKGKPMRSVTVELVASGRLGTPAFIAETDVNGSVLISGLAPGEYYLSTQFQGFSAGKKWIQVVTDPSVETKSRFDLQWADWSYETRRFEGTLSGLVPGRTGNKLQDLLHPVSVKYAGVDILLVDVFTEHEYRVVSDGNGLFILDPVPEGIYIVKIAGGMPTIGGIGDETTHVIDISESATQSSLPLELKDTGCYRREFQLAEAQ